MANRLRSTDGERGISRAIGGGSASDGDFDMLRIGPDITHDMSVAAAALHEHGRTNVKVGQEYVLADYA